MIQLKIYDTPAKETQHWLDLYDTEPIKLTLSIEDITSTDATSTFSKAFKVPGTRANAEFFKNSFDVDGIMYDVTIKKLAEILVDGTQFKQGHIRLQKVYLNTEQDRYDYELLFLGETRDFSSIIGDKGLCDLIMNDINGGDIAGSFLDPADVIQSWQAYPQTASLTNGLHDGNIIYPLIDHGNTYDDTGTVGESRIAIGNGNTNKPNFTEGSGANNSNPRKTVSLDRMKPMIRAKRLIDQIFEDAGYTYDSEFFDSDLFHQIYISAFGNTSTVALTGDDGGGSENTAYGDNQNSTQHTYDRLQWQNNWVDPGNNLSNPSSSPYGTVYTAPGAGTYDITARCFYVGSEENSDGTPYYLRATLQIYNYSTSTILAQSVLTGGTSSGATLIANGTGLSIGTGAIIGIRVIPETSTYQDIVNNVVFEVTSAPGRYTPASGLDCQYKQIDFIKDILTSFRLVLSPDSNDPKNFIIEPWQTYINSGNLYDWSDKLVENKDVQIEPVFFSQSDEINFKFQEGGDYTNIYHQQSFNEIYGQLDFTSGNDLLKGTREVKLLGIAPTELVNIQGASANDFVPIPQLHTHSSEDTGLQHLPIKPKTRMLFYNGLQSFTVPGNSHDGWYIQNDPVKRTVYPLVSPYENWPITTTSLNLNFSNDIQYWGTRTGYNDNGVTLYENYWSRYIASLYNKYSRRVTANFVLNNIDLNEFSFDDTIFVNGTYYRPEKIVDVQVGAYTEVLVQLLTANDFRPTLNLLQDLIINSATGIGSPCGGGLGSIDVNAEGTAPFTWSLSNGMTGAAVTGASPGPPPYTFTISNIPVGTYTLTLVDSLGRNADISVTIPQSIVAPVTSTFIATPASDCVTCDGAVNVTPVGGISPYTIVWNDGNTSFSRTGLCPGVDYSYTVYDSLGCSYESTLVQITCEGPQVNVYKFGRIGAECNTMIADFKYVELISPPNISDVYTLESIGGEQVYNGCWSYIGVVGGVADAQLGQAWIDCETCQGIVTNPTSWKVQSCLQPIEQIPYDNSTRWISLTSPFTVQAGQIVKDTTGPFDQYSPCYTVIELDNTEPPNTDFSEVYDDCATCAGITPTYNYRIADCESGQSYNMEKGGCTFIVGDVLQYIRNSDPTRIYCGTVIDVSFPTGFEDSTIYGCIGRDCDDFKHCDIAAP